MNGSVRIKPPDRHWDEDVKTLAKSPIGMRSRKCRTAEGTRGNFRPADCSGGWIFLPPLLRGHFPWRRVVKRRRLKKRNGGVLPRPRYET